MHIYDTHKIVYVDGSFFNGIKSMTLVKSPKLNSQTEGGSNPCPA